ncbi:MFS transporter [Streptomyces sp. RFCAC02]|uniref:MFS transporter n=1 Tax=Streptomyces sp. RFCAC02 TaxID=2499143 RepID=UPI001020E41F|nr:MFS transporter [Streptomyces sp. RFCAC02]
MAGARPLGGLLAAVAVSQTGTRLSAIALPWFVLASGGGAARTGLVAFCEMTPYVLVKLLSGPVVDRAGPRVVSWTTDLVSASCVLLVPLLHGAGALPFWLLLVLVACIGAARGPGDLAKGVMVPAAADLSGVPLERATGLSGVVERLAGTVGPAAGGALIAVTGAMAGLVANAVCFALGSLLIAAALPRGLGGRAAGAAPRAPDPAERGSGYRRRFAEGLAFLRGEPMLLGLVLLVGFTNFLDAAYSAVLLPVWAQESGHGTPAIGLLAGTFGGAAVCGSLVAATYAHRLRRRPVFFLSFLIGGAPRFLALAFSADGTVPLWAVVPVFAVGGFGSGFLNPIIGAMSFERIPRDMLGRVQAIGASVAFAGIPLGGLMAGALVGTVGIVPVIVAAAVLYFTATTAPALLPAWRSMERTPQPLPTPA